jgi:hypothetical protein
MFSCGKCIVDKEDIFDIVYFVWAWDLEQVLTRAHVLDDNMLFIDWGNVQSAVHFAKKIGCDRVKFYGVDGQAVDGKYHCDKVVENFGETRQPLKKLDQDYARTKNKLNWLATKLKLIVED